MPKDRQIRPTPEEQKAGILRKYNITRADGSPTDPGAEYFVLRLDDGGKDPVHVRACRAAIMVYKQEILHHLPALAADIERRYAGFGAPRYTRDDPRYATGSPEDENRAHFTTGYCEADAHNKRLFRTLVEMLQGIANEEHAITGSFGARLLSPLDRLHALQTRLKSVIEKAKAIGGSFKLPQEDPSDLTHFEWMVLYRIAGALADESPQVDAIFSALEMCVGAGHYERATQAFRKFLDIGLIEFVDDAALSAAREKLDAAMKDAQAALARDDYNTMSTTLSNIKKAGEGVRCASRVRLTEAGRAVLEKEMA